MHSLTRCYLQSHFFSSVKICGSLSLFTVGSLVGWQTETERGERMAQESTGSERTRAAAAWIIVE